MSSKRTLLLALSLAAGLFNCRSVDIVATRLAQDVEPGQDGSVGAVDASAPTVTDGSAPAVPDGGHGFCEQQGPTLRVGDNAANTAFCHALCVCTEYTAGNDLTTNAFDSSWSSDAFTATGGSVGVNGDLATDEVVTQLGGSLQVAGPAGINLSLSAQLLVEGHLRTSGDVQGSDADVEVRGDAAVQGRIDLDSLRVGGTLTMAEGAELNLSVRPSQLTVQRTNSIQVAEPCGCAPGDLKDIAREVAKRETDNDNAALDFDLTELNNTAGSITQLLPCGLFFLDHLTTPQRQTLTLVVTGRAALYVGGHVDLAGPFTVDLRPGAELDLFFAEGMLANADMTLGSRDDPERVRLYVGGPGTVELRGRSFVAGHIYAPRAELVVAGPTEVYGSVFVRRIENTAGLTIHYDRNPVESGAACPVSDSEI